MTLERRFQSLYDQIWAAFDKASQTDEDLNAETVPSEIPETAQAIAGERAMAVAALRGLAGSCKSLAHTMRSMSGRIEPGSSAYTHFSNVAEFAERYVERDLSQFSEIQASYLRAIKATTK